MTLRSLQLRALPVCASFVLAFLCYADVAKADSFSWANVGGLSYVTPITSQGTSGMCWAFGATAALESDYLITRGDVSYTPDLSELQLANANVGDYSAGGYAQSAVAYCVSTGLLRESEIPWSSTYSSTAWAAVTATSGWQSRAVKSDAAISSWYSPNVDALKSYLKLYGPSTMGLNVGQDWYSPSTDTYGSGSDGHTVCVIGYVDNASLANAGGGYFIIKNSWGGTSYNYVSYATVGTGTKGNKDVCLFTTQAYMTGATGTRTWTSGSGSWSTNAAKWTSSTSSSVAWANGEESAVFSNSGGGAITLTSGLSAHSITFSSTGYTLAGSGSTMCVTVGGINANESASINTKLTLGGSQTWSVAAGKTLTVSGTVDQHISQLTLAGSGSVTLNAVMSDIRNKSAFDGLLTGYQCGVVKNSTGDLNIGGCSIYCGDTSLNVGTIKFAANGVGLVNSKLIMASNTTLNVNGYTGTIGLLTQTSTAIGQTVTLGSGTLAVGSKAGSSAAFSGVISGIGALNKVGDSVQTLTGTNTYSGGTLFTGGYLAVSSLSNLGSGGLAFNGGGLRFLSSFDPTATRTVTTTGSGAQLDVGGLTVTFAGNVTGTGAIYKQGAGTLRYSTAKTYIGSTVVCQGTLQAAAANILPNGAGKSGLSLSPSASFDLNGYDQTVNALTGYGSVNNSAAGTAMLIVGSNGATSAFSGVIKNTGGDLSLQKVGAGTFTVANAQNYSGATYITAGTLKLASASGQTGLLVGSIASFNSTATPSSWSASSSGPTLLESTISANTTWVYSGNIYVAAGGVDTWYFKENYNNAIALSIDSQTVLSDSSAVNSAVGSISMSVGWHSIEIRISCNNGTGGPYSGGVNGNGWGLAVDPTTGSGSSYRSILDSSITSRLATSLSTTAALPGGTDVIMSNATKFYLNGISTTVGCIRDASGATGQTVMLGSAILTVGGSNKSGVYSGSITGIGGLTKIGTGVETLQGETTYTGTTTIKGGTLALVGSGSLANSAAIVMASDTTLSFSGASTATIKALNDASGASGQNVVLTGVALTIGDSDNYASTYSGAISGSGSITKAGSGAMTLSGTIACSGSALVEAGALTVAGGIAEGAANLITVKSGAAAVLSSVNVTKSDLTVTTETASTFAAENGEFTLGSIIGDGSTVVGANAVLTVSCLVQDTLILGGDVASVISGATTSAQTATSESVPEPNVYIIILLNCLIIASSRVRIRGK